MIEKVNPAHPDKIADRIAGAIVDLAYKLEENPKVAVEVLIGHGACNIIAETSFALPKDRVGQIVNRISGIKTLNFLNVEQDKHLADNQVGKIRCGDNGIFKGMPLTEEQKRISRYARILYERFSSDGKYILDGDRFIVCQSNATEGEIREILNGVANEELVINPLGFWTGGLDVDTGAVNRKLGSDMAGGVTGGGLHGKDISKADVAVNVYAHMVAQHIGAPIEFSCAIGDEAIRGISYSDIVKAARGFIADLGGFEKLAEWGLY